MSVVVGVRKRDQLVMAADTLTSAAGIAHRGAERPDFSKIVQLPRGGYMASVGSTTHIAVLRSLVRNHASKLDFTSVDNTFEALLALQPVLRETYFVRADESEHQEYDSNQLVLLIASPHGLFHTHSYREVHEYGRFFAIGSGDELALGAMHALYDRMDDPEAIAYAAVEAACHWTTSCGVPIETRTVQLVT